MSSSGIIVTGLDVPDIPTIKYLLSMVLIQSSKNTPFIPMFISVFPSISMAISSSPFPRSGVLDSILNLSFSKNNNIL